MHNKTQYSDEHLNAFIDNQLDTTEKAEILDAVRHDAELSQRVCELQKLQNLVQLSYQSIEVPEHHKVTKNSIPSVKFKWFAAASFFLAIGSIAGWITHQTIGPTSLVDIAQINQNPMSTNTVDHWKLMLHVSTAKPHKLNIVLDEAEALLKKYANSSRKLELEILANSDGIALVTNNGQDYNTRLQQLQNKYANLAVIVCEQTLKRVQHKQNKKLNLLPNIDIVPSAINQIIKRQQGGWSYIRI